MKTVEKHIKATLKERNIFPKDDLWNQIEIELDKPEKKKRSLFLFSKIAIAASLVLFVVVSIFLFKNTNQENNKIYVNQQYKTSTKIQEEQNATQTKFASQTTENTVNVNEENTNQRVTEPIIHNTTQVVKSLDNSIVSETTQIATKEEKTIYYPNANNNTTVEVQPQLQDIQVVENTIPHKKNKKKYTNSDALLFSVENEEQLQLTKKTFTEQAVAYVEENIK